MAVYQETSIDDNTCHCVPSYCIPLSFCSRVAPSIVNPYLGFEFSMLSFYPICYSFLGLSMAPSLSLMSPIRMLSLRVVCTRSNATPPLQSMYPLPTASRVSSVQCSSFVGQTPHCSTEYTLHATHYSDLHPYATQYGAPSSPCSLPPIPLPLLPLALFGTTFRTPWCFPNLLVAANLFDLLSLLLLNLFGFCFFFFLISVLVLCFQFQSYQFKLILNRQAFVWFVVSFLLHPLNISTTFLSAHSFVPLFVSTPRSYASCCFAINSTYSV